MYPQRFDLRHFMSHLAPGGYYLFQIVLLAIFAIWLFAPELVSEIQGAITGLTTLTGALAALGLFVMCYFVGVVLRMPSVDGVELQCIRSSLREHIIARLLESESQWMQKLMQTSMRKVMQSAMGKTLQRLTRNLMRNSLPNWKWIREWLLNWMWIVCVRWQFRLRFVPRALLSNARKMYVRWRIPRDLACEPTMSLLMLTTAQHSEVRALVSAWREHTSADWKQQTLDHWLLYLGTKMLREAHEKCFPVARIEERISTKESVLGDHACRDVAPLLWAVDRFPFPIWFSIKTYVQYDDDRATGGERNYRDNFERYLWPLFVDTTRGYLSKPGLKANRVHGYTKEPFNFCKQFVRSQNTELTADIDEREALTRMATGFYQGLDLGCQIGLWISAACIFAMAVSAVWTPLRVAPIHESYEYLIPTMSSLAWSFFNWRLLKKVRSNFHILRMSEAQAVFNAYLIAVTSPKKSPRPAPDS